MGAVDLGGGQSFWFETIEDIDIAIARLSKRRKNQVLKNRRAERKRAGARNSEVFPGYVGWQYVLDCIVDAAEDEKFSSSDEDLDGLSRHFSGTAGRLWGSLLSVTERGQMPFDFLCSHCGTDGNLEGYHGVLHKAGCKVRNRYKLDHFLVSKESLLRNADAFLGGDFRGVGKTIKAHYAVVVQSLT